MSLRNIQAIVLASLKDMDGVPVWQGFPTAHQDRIDPFLLLHHLQMKVPAYVSPRHAGVPPHPHRGFSPVTFVYKGGVHHRDSRGNNNTVYEGGTQWLNAGMGIIHSERPPADIQEIGGEQEMIQLWVNVPIAHKMDQPSYYSLDADATPTVKTEDGLATIRVVSGDILGTKGAIPTVTPVNTAMISAKAGAKLAWDIPRDHQAFLYILDGALKFTSGEEVGPWNTVVFKQDGEGIQFEVSRDASLFFASGLPIHEKVVAHGPYVMHTETAILEAMRDFQVGKMGILIEE